ncbi:MAG: DUF5681 domain-containing protein [Sphingomonadaceae bacterium]
MTEDRDEGPSSNQPESTDQGDEDSVGYGRPPAHSRWKKGQSGNPKGRVKGQRNLKTDLREELGEIIRFSENGTARGITKQRALLKSLTARGIKGDARSAQIVLALVKELLDQDAEPLARTVLTSQEQSVIDRFLKRNDLQGGQS